MSVENTQEKPDAVSVGSTALFASFCKDREATWRTVVYPRDNSAATKAAIEGMNQLLDDGWLCAVRCHIQGDVWRAVFVRANKPDEERR
jgi:hypothetical protein